MVAQRDAIRLGSTEIILARVNVGEIVFSDMLQVSVWAVPQTSNYKDILYRGSPGDKLTGYPQNAFSP